MSEIILSKEAKTLIRAIYKEYKRRRKAGMPKDQARSFGDSDTIQANILDKWNINDIDEACQELNNAGLIDCLLLDSTIGETDLTDEGINFMENYNTGKLSVFWKLLELVRSFLPW